jgi:general secretion pathway protein L
MASFSLILDIDEQGIRALVIEETKKGIVIEDSCHVFTKELFTSDNSDQSEQKEPNLFFETLDLISKKINLKDCFTAILFIPSSIVAFRDTMLPFKSKSKLRQVLDYELGFMLPIDNTKYLFDYISTNITLLDQQNLIFTVSVIEKLVKNYFDSLQHFDIKPELITIKGYLKAEWLAKKEDSSNIIFLDIQGFEKTLSFVINNKVVLIRSLKFVSSTENLVSAISNTYMAFMQKTRIDLLFDKIIITGKRDIEQGAGDKLIEMLSRAFQCSVEYAVVEGDLLKFLFKEKNSLLNMCQAQYKKDSFFKKNIKKVAATVAIAIFTSILAFVNISLDITSLEKELFLYKDAQVSIFKQTFPKQTKIQDPFMQMRALVSAPKAVNSDNTTNILRIKGIRAIDLLYELSERIPDDIDIVVSRLLFNNRRLIFSGLTNDFNNIDRIKNSLEKSDIFPSVNINKATADKKDGKVLFKFIIQF